MSKRNISKEIFHSYYYDPETGLENEGICYPSLICILTELCDRIEQLEERLNELEPPVNDVFGPTGLVGDPQ
jgi:hypothetical protein